MACFTCSGHKALCGSKNICIFHGIRRVFGRNKGWGLSGNRALISPFDITENSVVNGLLNDTMKAVLQNIVFLLTSARMQIYIVQF